MTTLKVRKPRAILFDIIGTVTKTGFVEKVLFPFVRNNIDTFLKNHWGKRVLMRDIDLLRVAALQDIILGVGRPAIVRQNESADKIRQSVVDYVIRCLDEARESEALRIFLFHMIFDGYNHNHLQTSVYSDVAIGLGNWSTKDGIKLYVFSNGWKYAMKKFLEKTNHADLSLVVQEFMDTEWGRLDDAKSYENIVAKLGYAAEDILLLTHSGVEGVAAHFAGLSVVLVTHRDELHREKTEETQKAKLPFIRTFNDLVFAGDAPSASTMGSSVDYVAPPRPVSSQPVSWTPRRDSATGGSGASRTKSGRNSKLSGSKSSATSSSKGSTSASGSNSSLSGGSTSKGSSGRSGSNSSLSGTSSKGSSGHSGSSSSVTGSSSKGSSSAASGSGSSASGSGSSASGSGSSATSGSSSSASSNKSANSKSSH